MIDAVDLRDAFFDEISRSALNDPNIVILTNDMQVNSLIQFREAYPERFINVGVAEQNMINVAAGLASTGKKVALFGILSFLTSRCYEQIKINICEMNLPVLMIGIGTGLSYSFDGPSHHSTTDIGVMRQLPEISIYNPVNAVSAQVVAKEVVNFLRPTLVRLDKGIHHNPDLSMERVSASTFISGGNVDKLVIFSGPILELVCNLLRLGGFNLDEFMFVGMNRVWPIPSEVTRLLESVDFAWIFEENYASGGIYNAISEYIALHQLSPKLIFVGLDKFDKTLYGERDWLRQQLGMTL